MHEADRPCPFASHDQPMAIEPRFGQHVLFDELRCDRLNAAADGPLRPPNLGQGRRVSIFEGAIPDQGATEGLGLGA